MYRLFKDTSVLPDFSRPRHVDTLYTTTLDYPLQPHGDEWFAIVYEGAFDLTSGDGAQLHIDGKRIINNGGIHGAESESESESGDVNLEPGYTKFAFCILSVRNVSDGGNQPLAARRRWTMNSSPSCLRRMESGYTSGWPPEHPLKLTKNACISK